MHTISNNYDLGDSEVNASVILQNFKELFLRYWYHLSYRKQITFSAL